LKGKMKAKKAEIATLSAEAIGANPEAVGLKGSTTRVVKVFSPEARGDRTMLSGTVDEQVEQLLEKLEKFL